jgi:preprotein translocase subunit SecD
VREGKQLRPAVEAGWKRARRTILVSDTVSFLAAVLLYYFAIGLVKENTTRTSISVVRPRV